MKSDLHLFDSKLKCDLVRLQVKWLGTSIYQCLVLVEGLLSKLHSEFALQDPSV